MSSEVVVSKSPLISGRFEWDTKIPRTFGDFAEVKRLQIDGQDGNTYTIYTEWVLLPSLSPFWFWTVEPIKGNVQIEVKVWTKNAESKILFHQKCSYRGLDLKNFKADVSPGQEVVRTWQNNIIPSVDDGAVTIELQIEIEECVDPKEIAAKNRLKALSDPEPSLAQALEDLRLNNESCDITIRCDNQTFPCHKLILSSRSDVFKTMFTMHDSKEEQNGIIEIEDISAKTMKTFLKFMYKDDLEIEEIDCNLLIAAEKYNFKRLFNICLKQIEKMINAKTVMEITIAAYLVDNKELLLKASEFIFKNRGSIRKCELWDQIKSKHPAIAAKVMDLMVFDEK